MPPQPTGTAHSPRTAASGSDAHADAPRAGTSRGSRDRSPLVHLGYYAGAWINSYTYMPSAYKAYTALLCTHASAWCLPSWRPRPDLSPEEQDLKRNRRGRDLTPLIVSYLILSLRDRGRAATGRAAANCGPRREWRTSSTLRRTPSTSCAASSCSPLRTPRWTPTASPSPTSASRASTCWAPSRA